MPALLTPEQSDQWKAMTQRTLPEDDEQQSGDCLRRIVDSLNLPGRPTEVPGDRVRNPKIKQEQKAGGRLIAIRVSLNLPDQRGAED